MKNPNVDTTRTGGQGGQGGSTKEQPSRGERERPDSELEDRVGRTSATPDMVPPGTVTAPDREDEDEDKDIDTDDSDRDTDEDSDIEETQPGGGGGAKPSRSPSMPPRA